MTEIEKAREKADDFMFHRNDRIFILAREVKMYLQPSKSVNDIYSRLLFLGDAEIEAEQKRLQEAKSMLTLERKEK